MNINYSVISYFPIACRVFLTYCHLIKWSTTKIMLPNERWKIRWVRTQHFLSGPSTSSQDFIFCVKLGFSRLLVWMWSHHYNYKLTSLTSLLITKLEAHFNSKLQICIYWRFLPECKSSVYCITMNCSFTINAITMTRNFQYRSFKRKQ